MASALQKLLRKSPPSRFITALHPSQPPNPFLCHLHPQSLLPSSPTPYPPSHQFAPSTVIFPSFPFGFASKPVLVNGFFPAEIEDAASEDSRTVWADSVKKKRKRKMNKHKLQKLRKRVRRQS